MRSGPAAALVIAALTLAALACADREPGLASGSEGLVARGVTVEVAVGKGTLVARGDRLELIDGGDELALIGDAGIALVGPSRLEARADRLRLSAEGPVVEMRGRVRALFEAPQGGAGDGGL